MGRRRHGLQRRRILLRPGECDRVEAERSPSQFRHYRGEIGGTRGIGPIGEHDDELAGSGGELDRLGGDHDRVEERRLPGGGDLADCSHLLGPGGIGTGHDRDLGAKGDHRDVAADGQRLDKGDRRRFGGGDGGAGHASRAVDEQDHLHRFGEKGEHSAGAFDPVLEHHDVGDRLGLQGVRGRHHQAYGGKVGGVDEVEVAALLGGGGPGDDQACQDHHRCEGAAPPVHFLAGSWNSSAGSSNPCSMSRAEKVGLIPVGRILPLGRSGSSDGAV